MSIGQKMSRTCEKHGMSLDLFCLSHNVAVCARCSQSDHFKCPQFVPVDDAAKYANRNALQRPPQPLTEKISSEKLLETVKNERNTFTNFVQAALDSGEDNTFTKYLKASDESQEVGGLGDRNHNEAFPSITDRHYLVEGIDRSDGEAIDVQSDIQVHTARPLSADYDDIPDIPEPSQRSHGKHIHNSPLSKKNSPSGNGVGRLLEDVRQFSKALSSRDDVGITLDDLLAKIDRTVEELAVNFENTKGQKKAIESQIKNLRSKINAHLDTMENKLMSSLHTKFRQCETSVANTIEKLQKGKEEVIHMKTGHVDNPNSQLQANTLLAIRENDKQMKRLKRSINTMAENVYSIDINVNINQDLIAFLTEGIQSFGEVTVNSQLKPKINDPIVEQQRRIEVIRPSANPGTNPPKTNRGRKPVGRSQSERVDKRKTVTQPKRSVSKREMVETTKRIDNVQYLPEVELGQRLNILDEPLPEIITTGRSGISGIKILQKKKVRIGHKWTSTVSNCKMLPNGRLIFIDTENKRLVVHNKDTYVYRNLRVHDPPRDFAIIDDDRIIVSFGHYLELLNILTSRIEKRIRFNFFECNGIAYMTGKYYVYGVFDGYLLSRHGIQILDTNGNVEDRLPITRVQTIHHSIATFNGRIYYTGYDNITCCATSGEEIWVFRHDTMDRPRSLTVDSMGNVFASYENENKIVVISVDGLYSKEFELRKHDLYYGQDPVPVSIFFDVVESALIVCNANKDHSVMYFVKYA